jgi:DNA-binding MarR family transcriptional regulator
MPAESGLDPVIHGQVRLRVMVTLAALKPGDDLSFTRLQELLGLTPGNLITHLRKLEDAGYVTTAKSGSGVTARTSVSLSPLGRQALDRYMGALRELLDSASAGSAYPNWEHRGPASGEPPPPPGSAVRRSNEAVL